MLFKNGFRGGMNKDADNSVMPPDSYIDARNLSLTSDGKFFALQNIKGTTAVVTLDASFSGKVLAVYANRYTIGTTPNKECLTIFTAETGGNFQIWCFDTQTNNIYKLFAQPYTPDFAASNTEIDGVGYSENNLDILYFTDNYNEVRKLRCEIPTGAADNFLTEQDLSLQRRATLATLLHTVSATGGSLLCGSYQFTVRLFNEDTRAYSRWTLLTIPVMVSAAAGEGYYGLASAKSITLTVRLLNSEITNWSHFQIGVIENTAEQIQTVGSLLQIRPLSGGSSFVSGFTDYSFSYKSNDKQGVFPLTDITVDLAAIQKAKTLAVKNNRLFLGNITYHNLEYDRTPSVTGSVSLGINANATDDNNNTAYRGYFRDEVYRFYIVYWDKFYNLSRPIRLDMSSIVGNQTSNGDMKFPARQGIYTLMNATNEYLNLGLALTVNNHPSWARGYAIFRAKRKKKKLFQTPYIPAVEIQGMEVLGDYPNKSYELNGSGSVVSKDYPSATPMNPVGTVLPKNMFFTVAQNIIQRDRDDSLRRNQKGECRYATAEWFLDINPYGFIFEPYSQYGLSNPYQLTSSDTLRLIDMAFLKLSYTQFDTGSAGKTTDYSAHGTFYATNNVDYWRQYNNVSSFPLGITTFSVVNYTNFNNYSEGVSLGGKDIFKYGNLQTSGIGWFSIANSMRIGAVQHTGFFDLTYFANSFKPGAIPAGNFRTASTIEGGTADNTYVVDLAGYVEDSSYVNSVIIADIENGLGDDRYGDADALHDTVFTGAYRVFSDSQLSTVVSSGNVPLTETVFGGDCYVSTHSFKLTENHFALVDPTKARNTSGFYVGELGPDLIRAWDKVFKNKYDVYSCTPVGFKNLSQVISVVLESEVNGEVLAKRPYTSTVGSGRATTTTSKGQSKIPFPYLYHRGYSQEADQKILVPFSDTEQLTTKYQARVAFSDQKIYNTDIQGFDVFRIANFVDLDESHYGITKLSLDGDNLVAIQEQGVAYIPVDAAMLSTTDAATISVRTGTVDTPLYLSRLNGSQHMKSVIKSGNSVFFADNRNQRVFRLSGGKVEPISDKGMIKQFNSDFATQVSDLRGMWDANRSEYSVFNGNFCYVWNDRLEVWVSAYDASPYDGVFAYNKLWAIGPDSAALRVFTMYTASANSMFGETYTPTLTVRVNPEYEKNKTFDVITVYSDGILDSADVRVDKEIGDPNQEALGMVFAYNRREGYYQLPTLRDANNARMRGTNAEVKLYWPTTGTITLSQIVTSYRPSARING